jgi:hypothetical protein
MNNGDFKFNIRTQFSFITNEHTLSCILSDIAEKKININGYSQTKINLNENVVRLVVGSTSSETDNDLFEVGNILKTFDVRFKKKGIIQIPTVSGIPGQINAIFSALWCKLNVKALYYGEDSLLYIDVLNLNKALKILSKE